MQSIPTRLELPSEFLAHLSDAIVRFRYLHPGVMLQVEESAVLLSSDKDERSDRELEREFLFCLYRQKVYAETLPLRSALIAGVTGA